MSAPIVLLDHVVTLIDLINILPCPYMPASLFRNKNRVVNCSIGYYGIFGIMSFDLQEIIKKMSLGKTGVF
jgi:hypothetical protein